MKIIHTADWHLGKSLEQISRLDEQREFIDNLCDIVAQENVDLILIAGDIYDTYNPSAAAEELFYYALEKLNDHGRRAVVVIAGNHDNPERLCAASPLAEQNGIILLGYPSSRAAIRSGGSSDIETVAAGAGWLRLKLPTCQEEAVILTLPYPSESRLEELLAQQADEALLQQAYSDKIRDIFAGLSSHFQLDTVNLIVSHLFLLGGKESESERTLQVGGALTVDPKVLPRQAQFAALGHLHRPQQIRSASCPTYYAGSPLSYSFSEAGQSKAVYLITAFPEKDAEVTPLYLNCGKPLQRWVAKGGIGEALAWCEAGKDSNAWIDLEIVTDRILTLEEQKRLRTLHPGIVNIRPRLLVEQTGTLEPLNREGKKIDELFKEYYHYRLGADVPEELMTAFLEVVNSEAEEGESNQ